MVYFHSNLIFADPNWFALGTYKAFSEKTWYIFIVSEYIVGKKEVEYSDLRDWSIVLVCYWNNKQPQILVSATTDIYFHYKYICGSIGANLQHETQLGFIWDISIYSMCLFIIFEPEVMRYVVYPLQYSLFHSNFSPFPLLCNLS